MEHCTGIAEVGDRVPFRPRFFIRYCSSNIIELRSSLTWKEEMKLALMIAVNSNVSNCLLAWKIQGFNGVRTHDPAIPVRRSNQLSYKAPKQWFWPIIWVDPVTREIIDRNCIWKESYAWTAVIEIKLALIKKWLKNESNKLTEHVKNPKWQNTSANHGQVQPKSWNGGDLAQTQLVARAGLELGITIFQIQCPLGHSATQPPFRLLSVFCLLEEPV